jgi:mycothiol synthase
MGTAGRLQVRAATVADADAITEVLDAYSRRWMGRVTTCEDTIGMITKPGTDPARDTVAVIGRGGGIVGFGNIWPVPPAELRGFARTHPVWVGHGVGAALQKVLVARASSMAAERLEGAADPFLTMTSSPGDEAAERLYEVFGYRPVRYFLRMRVDFATTVPPAPAPPAGIVVRPHRGAEDEALFHAWVEAFAESPGYEHADVGEWWHERRDAPEARYDPALWHVATAGAEIAGFVIGEVRSDADGNEHGYVSDVGVRPRWRGRGIAESLLGRALRVFGDRGLPYATLDVDAENTTGAVRLYRKLGMAPRANFTIWKRQLTTPE